MARKPTDLISFPMRLSTEVERLFDEMIHRPWGFTREEQGWNPSVDLYETDDGFILEADLPGVNPKDVKVEVQNGNLRLEGRRTIEQSRTIGRCHTMERFSGSFLRQIKLPESVDVEKITADFKDGVLRVTLPKSKEGKV